MDWKMISKLGGAILSGAIGFVEALHEDVDYDVLKTRALDAIEANRATRESAEALERSIFTSSTDPR